MRCRFRIVWEDALLGIIVCGLNGVGKSTLGKALADKLGYHFIDNEDLYFPKTDPDYIYASQRTQEEVERLLLERIRTYNNFVFASVKGDYGETACSFFRYAVLIEVPRDIRLQRVINRSFGKFGKRMLEGGDLYKREESFFELVRSRSEDTVEKWIGTVKIPVIRIDGTKPIEENIGIIIERINKSAEGQYGICDLKRCLQALSCRRGNDKRRRRNDVRY